MENFRSAAARYGAAIQVLLLLFFLRVTGQFIQVWSPVGFLPALDQWQGSGIPYPWLLFVQVIILILGVPAAVRLKGGRIRPNRKLGNTLLIAGAIYFGVMLARLLLGLTILSEHHWFSRYIPAFFHLVLAGIVLTFGDYHRRYSAAL